MSGVRLRRRRALFSVPVGGCVGDDCWRRGRRYHQVPGTHLPWRVQPQWEGAPGEWYQQVGPRVEVGQGTWAEGLGD